MSVTNLAAVSKMNVFDFDPADYAEEYRVKGYVHIKGGVNPAFLQYAQENTKELLENATSLEDWTFKGKKQQFLMEFPEASDFPSGVYDAVAAVADVSREKLTMCERHIKAYEPNAKTNVPPHKDRAASQVTVGLPLVVPEGSHLVIWPDHHLTVNPYDTTAHWRNSLDEEDLPENLLKDIEPVRVFVEPGDVIMFKGSSLYHEREKPASTSVLYLKFNALRLDPLGEDPSTPAQRERSLELLTQKSDEEMLNCGIEVSPRLLNITRQYSRLHWREMIQGHISGQKEFTLSETEFALIRSVGDDDTVLDVIDKLGGTATDMTDYLPIFHRLGKLGAIDILD